MKKILILPALFVLVSACASQEAIEANRRNIEASDHDECLHYGYQPNSPGYGDCRLRLKEIRVEANRPVYSPGVGVGYDYGYGHRRW